MQCPNDQTTLLMTERLGIEIDYCPTCRGVWLDKGELDKLIANNEQSNSAPAPTPQAPPQPNYGAPQGYPQQQPPHHNGHKPYYHKRKKESFLGDLFDF